MAGFSGTARKRGKTVAALAIVPTLLFGLVGMAGLRRGPNAPPSQASAAPVGPACVLPFRVGESYRCFNAWGGPIGHTGVFYYSTDFSMPIGTVITAARAGVIQFVEVRYHDSDTQFERSNVVVIRHDDGTFSRYAHLTHDGALVQQGQAVAQGAPIALSGSSGSELNGRPVPHLHFDVTTGCPQTTCQTIPYTLTNASPHTDRPTPGVTYTAEPYGGRLRRHLGRAG